MRLTLRKFLAVLLALTMALSVPMTLGAAEEYTTVSLDVTYCQTNARSILDMINEFRTGDETWYWNSDDTTKTELSDLCELTYDYALEEIAMQRAAEIALSFDHTRPNGESCFGLYSGETTNVYITSRGENIAAGYRTAAAVFAGWQETNASYAGQGHRRNMLNSSYTAVGIACVYYNGTYYWVQEFGRTVSSAAETTANDSSATVNVDISTSSIESIDLTVSSESYDIAVGDTVTVPVVTATIMLVEAFPESTSTVTVSADWSSGDLTVASVSEDELIAVSKGSTVITTTAFDTELSAEVTVHPTVANCAVTVDSSNLTYSGSAISPTLTVMDGTTALTQGTDYTVTYSDNVNAGTATATITGAGDYVGTKTVEFTIAQAAISSASASVAGTYTYDGTSKEPTLTVTYNSMTLTLGTDYTVAYSNNVNAGTATATITGKGNYKGTSTVNFTINKAGISSCTASLSEVSYLYDGTEKKPVATLTLGSYTLKEGTDYTVSYANNKDVGTASVTITAVSGGNFSGSTTLEFAIAQLGDVNADGEIDYLDAMTVLRYDAELITLTDGQFLAGDVNQDGEVDSLDAITILRYDADLIESL